MSDIENIDACVECMAAEAKFETKAPFVVTTYTMQEHWNLVIGEQLNCEREEGNAQDS